MFQVRRQSIVGGFVKQQEFPHFTTALRTAMEARRDERDRRVALGDHTPTAAYAVVFSDPVTRHVEFVFV